MRTLLVIVLPPTFDDYFRFPQIIEPFHVQAFIAQSAVEAFSFGILPRATRFDIKRANLFLAEPIPYTTCDELRPIV